MRIRQIAIVVLIGLFPIGSEAFAQFPPRGSFRGFSLRTPAFGLDVIPPAPLGLRRPPLPPMPPLPRAFFPPLPGGTLRGRVDLGMAEMRWGDPRPRSPYRGALERPGVSARPPAPRFALPEYGDVSRRADAASPDATTSAARPAVADSLLAAVARLRTRLKDRPEGDVWLDYLQLDSVARLAEELSGGGRLDALAGEAGTSGRAARLLEPFEAAERSSGFAWLSRGEDFRTITRALDEIADGPSAGVKRQTGEAAEPAPERDGSDAPEAFEQLPLPQPDPPASRQTGRPYRGDA